jgi:hypothetical protein
MTTTATATTRGIFGWMRTLVLTASIALLGLTLLPPAAEAAMSQADISANTLFQIALCEAGGGKAQVEVIDRTVQGVRAMRVDCNGGVFGGMYCDNDSVYGVTCTGAHPHPVPPSQVGGRPIPPHLWQTDLVLPVLEGGSLAQIERLVADVEVAFAQQMDADPTRSRRDDRPVDQDSSHGKHKQGKQGKQGKHGGKGHRK